MGVIARNKVISKWKTAQAAATAATGITVCSPFAHCVSVVKTLDQKLFGVNGTDHDYPGERELSIDELDTPDTSGGAQVEAAWTRSNPRATTPPQKPPPASHGGRVGNGQRPKPHEVLQVNEGVLKVNEGVSGGGTSIVSPTSDVELGSWVRSPVIARFSLTTIMVCLFRPSAS
eukprot:COSAG05_NODE_180_length_14817_cov_423.925262_1_plen_174_part_00